MGKGKRGVRDHIFWKHRYSTVYDVMISETDSMTYQRMQTQKIVDRHDKDKKYKYLEACLQNRRHFTSLVVSTGGIIRREVVH